MIISLFSHKHKPKKKIYSSSKYIFASQPDISWVTYEKLIDDIHATHAKEKLSLQQTYQKEIFDLKSTNKKLSDRITFYKKEMSILKNKNRDRKISTPTFPSQKSVSELVSVPFKPIPKIKDCDEDGDIDDIDEFMDDIDDIYKVKAKFVGNYLDPYKFMDDICKPKAKANPKAKAKPTPGYNPSPPKVSGTLSDLDLDLDIVKLLSKFGMAMPKRENLYLTDIIAKNYDEAYDEIPESFIQVDMLYVNIQINGMPYNAFIDTGAQITIMPLKIAKELGLSDLIYKGASTILKGVGTKKAIGKIFKLDIIIGSSIIPCPFTIVEDLPDIILGLDIMKTNGCIIDLKKRGMNVGKEFIRFLNSNEIKK